MTHHHQCLKISNTTMGLGNLFCLLLMWTASWGNLLVVEYKAEGQDSYHGDTVSHIACLDPFVYCELYNTQDFLEDFVTNMDYKLQQFDVVNMSLFFQKPDFEAPDNEKENFNLNKKNLEDIIYQNTDVLFVVAAGNGFAIGFLDTPSVPLGDRFKVYPANFESENLIKVTAVNEAGLDFEDLKLKTLGSRVNYGRDQVDVAAVVEKNHMDEVLIMTSTATPVVARLASRLRHDHSGLEPRQIKEIIMKTVYVKNLDEALVLEEDLKENGEESLISKLQNEKNYHKREELRQKMGGVLLVKSGGVVVPKAAQLCAEIYEKAVGLLTLEQSCLEAQKQTLFLNAAREEKLKKLWEYRGF